MGTSDGDDGLIVIDTIRPDADAELVIDREVLEGYWYRSVSWGVRPAENDGALPVQRLVSDFADSTLFVSWIPEWSYHSDWDRRRFTETLPPDDDESYQASVYLRTQLRVGVYHSLLPQYYIPVALSAPVTTRLVSVRRSKTSRLALTWLFSDGLEVHFRIARVSPRNFRLLRAESLLNAKSDAILGSAIVGEMDRLPANDDTWRAVAEALRAVDGDGRDGC